MRSGLIICGGDSSFCLGAAKTLSSPPTGVLLLHRDGALVLPPETIPVKEGAWCLMSATWGREQGPTVVSTPCWEDLSMSRQGPASSL